jgi:hypothetical protein
MIVLSSMRDFAIGLGKFYTQLSYWFLSTERKLVILIVLTVFHEGDPLSPLFLCIVEEILSRSLSNLANNGNICPMNLCRGLQFLLMRFYHVQLVPSIIYGKVIYSFHVYLWPKNILKKLDSWFRNFVWSGDVSMRKIYNVALKQICVSYITGCLDLWPL